MKTPWQEFKETYQKEMQKVKEQQQQLKQVEQSKQVQCPKCNSFKIQSAREKLVIFSLALIFASPWMLLLMLLIGPFAIIASIGGFGLGVLLLVIGILARGLSKQYTCEGCNYNWEKSDSPQSNIENNTESNIDDNIK